MADQILQDIKDRLNVADIISGYIPIKKAGANFKALCPFHHEKTPSLQISPQKQIWHCFGCGEGGDAFGFVMKYENLEFRDALKLLADKAGVRLPEYRPVDKAQVDEKELLLRINDFAARYYHEVLLSKTGQAALDYLKNRGLADATISKWQIGFAPDDFHALEQALAKKSVNIESSIKAGVLAKNERGQVYDRFRGRITFPIFDLPGQVVGFSARILKDDGKSAKYINSPETMIYSKSKILFGFNFAKNNIRKYDEAVIVEGQMDCIAAHQASFINVVASSGTALTQDQFALLGRFTKNLKFCLDEDLAGQNATNRAKEVQKLAWMFFQTEVQTKGKDTSFLSQPFKIKVISLVGTGAKDPDGLIRRDPETWKKVVENAVGLSDYVFNRAFANFNQDSIESKKQVRNILLPYIQDLFDSLEKDHYIKLLASRLAVDEKLIRSELDELEINRSKVINKILKRRSSVAPEKRSGLLAQKEVLGGLLFNAEFAKEIAGQIQSTDFEDSEIAQLIGFWLNSQVSDQVRQATIAKEALFMVESQLEELDGNETALRRELTKAFALLKINSIKRRQQELQSQIKSAELAKNKHQIDQISQKFAQLSDERMRFENLL